MTAEHVEPAPRVGGWVVMTDDYPGAWGWGATVEEARAQWRRHGGRGAWVEHSIDPYWQGAWVDVFGRVHATVTDPASADVPRRDRPPVIVEAWRVATNGRRRRLDLD